MKTKISLLIVLVVASVLVLSGCGGGGLNLPSEPTEPTVFTFEDNFSDSSSGWAISDESNYSLSYNGAYSITLKSQYMAAYSGAPIKQIEPNYTLEVASYVGYTDSNMGLDMGLLFNGVNLGNSDEEFYAFFINPTIGEYAVCKYEYADDKWTDVIDNTSSDQIKMGLNKLSVVQDGTAVKLKINDVEIATVNVDQHDKVSLGLILNNYDESMSIANFDNFYLKGLK